MAPAAAAAAAATLRRPGEDEEEETPAPPAFSRNSAYAASELAISSDISSALAASMARSSRFVEENGRGVGAAAAVVSPSSSFPLSRREMTMGSSSSYVATFATGERKRILEARSLWIEPVFSHQI